MTIDYHVKLIDYRAACEAKLVRTQYVDPRQWTLADQLRMLEMKIRRALVRIRYGENLSFLE